MKILVLTDVHQPDALHASQHFDNHTCARTLKLVGHVRTKRYLESLVWEFFMKFFFSTKKIRFNYDMRLVIFWTNSCNNIWTSIKFPIALELLTNWNGTVPSIHLYYSTWHWDTWYRLFLQLFFTVGPYRYRKILFTDTAVNVGQRVIAHVMNSSNYLATFRLPFDHLIFSSKEFFFSSWRITEIFKIASKIYVYSC